MQTGNTGFHGLVMCFCLGSSVLLARGLDMDMERTTATSQKAVRQAPSLCAGEQEYVHQRKRVVLQSLRRLAVNCTADSVPHIALLASGGGQRAAVGLVGSLYQMEKEGLLDCLLYLGGVSGSTWSMSSVYSDPEWSINIDATVARLSGPGVELEAVLAWLGERAKEENFSLTDIWGVFTSAGIMKQMDLRHLSDEASRNTTNPYPIYSAIEKHCFSSGPIEGQWFEVSPHEAGFTELGLFVETSLLGSKFKSGELLEETPEMDMVKLQGVLGCALAHEDTMKEFIPPWLNVAGQRDSAAEEYLRVYSGLHKLVALTRSTVKDPTALSYLGELQQILEDQMKRSESAWLEPKSVEERKRLSQLLRTELLTAVETWSESLEAGAFRTQVSLLTTKVLPKIIAWEWGTTSNFLYQYQDAGLLMNVAYPPFLGEKRDIDLIIAPEYSAGNVFETLTLARDYAAAVKKPFPEIDEHMLEEREWPKDCYVLEGKGSQPSIIYMPLFNRRNCRDAEEVKEKMEKFSTFQLPFSQEKMEFVLETAKDNIRSNRDALLREVHKAVAHRHQRKSVLL
ncbi:cytosolic phospholipase A2 beta-like isoform X2 [Pseudoliparis swirei]|uniref:cytosolic phospholipase A2 beta-like isoform X2 n=1 Tax=Pseudoliparis swirei TaxID=2059687 RepID=UPI0024BD8C2C|nr:cytosolic phospholipase A2 beta-like isoform X2 [Pseudoliparis swirei]